MSVSLAFLENLRPRQWTKNLLLLAGIIFARKLGTKPAFGGPWPAPSSSASPPA